MAEMSRKAMDVVNLRLREMCETGYLRLWRYSEDGEKMPGWPASMGVLRCSERVPWSSTVSLTASEQSDGWLIESEDGNLIYAQAVGSGLKPGRTLALEDPVIFTHQ